MVNSIEAKEETQRTRSWNTLVSAFACLAHDLIENGEAEEILNETDVVKEDETPSIQILNPKEKSLNI